MAAKISVSTDKDIGICGSFTDKSYSNFLMHGLHGMLQDQEGLDFHLIVENEKISAHRVVLAAGCPFFRANFVHDGEKSTLELPDLTAKAVKHVIEFLYTGNLSLTSCSVDDLFDIYRAADFLGVLPLQGICIYVLANQTNCSNCLRIAYFASFNQCKDLIEFTTMFYLTHFSDIICCDDFLELPIEFLKQIFSYSEVQLIKTKKVISPKEDEQELEAVLLKHILRYIDVDTKTRIENFSELLKLVNVGKIKSSELSSLKKKALKMGISKDLWKKSVANCCVPVERKARVKYEMVLKASPPLASGGHVTSISDDFNDSVDVGNSVYVVGMTIRIRRWDGRPVLGGMDVTYSNGKTVTHGDAHHVEKYSFELKEGERINTVVARCGWLVDSLLFLTNTKRKFGPYGGPGGHEEVLKPKDQDGFLSSFRGDIVSTQGYLAITSLSAIWGSYKLRNMPLLLDDLKTAVCPNLRISQ